MSEGKKPTALHVLETGSKMLTQTMPPDSATTVVSNIPGDASVGKFIAMPKSKKTVLNHLCKFFLTAQATSTFLEIHRF